MTKPYQPSNATDYDVFTQTHCYQCARWKTFELEDGDTGKDCGLNIMFLTRWHGIGDPEYPPELVYSDDNIPMCTAFQTEQEAAQERYMDRQKKIEGDGQQRLFG